MVRCGCAAKRSARAAVTSVFRGCDLRYASFGTRSSFASDGWRRTQGSLTPHICVRRSDKPQSRLVNPCNSASRNPRPPRARVQHHCVVHTARCGKRLQNRFSAASMQPLHPPAMQLAVPTRSLHRQAARRAHAPRRMCTPPRAMRARNGAPSPEPHHRRAAQPSLHTHDAVTPVTRRRDAPPRVTAAPRATLVAHARP